MVSSDVSWSEHVDMTINKADKLLGLVHSAFSTLCKSLVHPVLEYAALV